MSMSLRAFPPNIDGKLRALYMPDDVLDGGIAFDLFKTELTETKANAVVIDFKTKDGYLNYVSSVGTANDIGASSKAYQNALATIDRLKSAGYKIIARIYCYEDSVAASHLGRQCRRDKLGRHTVGSTTALSTTASRG